MQTNSLHLRLYKGVNVWLMGNLLYWIAVLLVIAWAITFLGGYYTGGLIHALLVIAVIAVLLKIIKKAS